MTKDRAYRFERIVFWLGIPFLGVPFLGSVIVAQFPLPTHEADLGASLLNALDPLCSLWLAIFLSTSLVINLAYAVRRPEADWNRPLPRSVAELQLALFGLITVWVLTVSLNATLFDHNPFVYVLVWFEAAALGALPIVVLVRARDVRQREIPELDPAESTDPVTPAQK